MNSWVDDGGVSPRATMVSSARHASRQSNVHSCGFEANTHSSTGVYRLPDVEEQIGDELFEGDVNAQTRGTGSEHELLIPRCRHSAPDPVGTADAGDPRESNQ